MLLLKKNQNNYNIICISKITMINTIIMKKREILWELSNCDRDMKWANAIEKMVPIDLLEKGLLQISSL